GEGCNSEPLLPEAGLYDPGSDRWTRLDTTATAGARVGQAIVWTGKRVLVWGGWSGADLADGFLFDPASGDWTRMDAAGAPPARHAISALAWTGTQMIVWGGIGAGAQPMNSGGVYTPPW